MVAKHELISLKLKSPVSWGEESYPCMGIMFPCLNQLLCLGTRYASRFKPVRASQGLPLVLCIEHG